MLESAAKGCERAERAEGVSRSSLSVVIATSVSSNRWAYRWASRWARWAYRMNEGGLLHAAAQLLASQQHAVWLAG